MLPLEVMTPNEIASVLANRLRELRLYFGWTREELAERAGITTSSLKRFETTGKISLERLLLLAMALDALRDFEALFPLPPAQTLEELEKQTIRRQRGRRKGDV